jgi:hypothetical protein
LAFIFAVMMPIAIAYSRRIWRSKPKETPPRTDDLSGARLERLEQAVDSIAIEIERVSEGQRFVTKVLSERMPVVGVKHAAGESAEPQLRALVAGPIEPIRVAERQAVRRRSHRTSRRPSALSVSGPSVVRLLSVSNCYDLPEQ